MTYCVAMKLDEGLVALADGRVTSGNQVATAHKLTLHDAPSGRFFVATSGLRSLRDKTLNYLERALTERPVDDQRTMLAIIDAYADQLRIVAEEDKEALADAALEFNLHALIGGAMPDEPEPRAFMVYPQANWIEIGARTPYLTIGATPYGKPILDRALRHDTDLRSALKLAYLSFDSTRASAADVGFPIDIATFARADRQWRTAQLDYDDVREQRQWWNDNLTRLARELPDEQWADVLPAPALTVVPGQGEV